MAVSCINIAAPKLYPVIKNVIKHLQFSIAVKKIEIRRKFIMKKFVKNAKNLFNDVMDKKMELPINIQKISKVTTPRIKMLK